MRNALDRSYRDRLLTRSWCDFHDSHDSENKTLADNNATPGVYSRNMYFKGASISQLVCLINIYPHCEQFINYECFVSALMDGFWLSTNSEKMTYRSGAAH